MGRQSSQDQTCIYCEQPAGSKEHLFPAACGGLKQDRSILCTSCNGQFGRSLDNHLVASLRELNGLLGVQDRSQNTKPAIFHDPKTGNSYEIDQHGVARLAEPVTKHEEEKDNVLWVNLSAGTHKQLDDWIKKKKDSGHKIAYRMRRNIVHNSGPPQLSKEITISSKEMLRESARIVLNFLAHFFPELARMEERNELKKFITNPDSAACAFYTIINPTEYFGQNLYRFGHRVVIVCDENSSSLYGFISYFSSLNILVNLGPTLRTKNFTKIIDIDPLAEREPNDISARNDIHLDENLIPYLPLTETEQDKFYDQVEMRFSELNRNIHKYQREKIYITMWDCIKNTQDWSESNLFGCLTLADALFFESILTKVLYLCETINNFTDQQADYKIVIDFLLGIVGRSDPLSSSVIHPKLVQLIEACRRATASQILENHPSNQTITLTYLNGLLSEEGILGLFSSKVVDQLVLATLGKAAYDSLSRKLYSQ